jgi:DNA-binding IclR family transcriptional regulator
LRHDPPVAAELSTAALQHGLAVVDHVLRAELTESQPPGVVRLAESAGLDKGRASRMLRELGELGMLHRDGETRGFRAGPGLFRAAARAGGAMWDGTEVRSLLRRLAVEHGASAYLSVLSGGAVLVVRAEVVARGGPTGVQPGGAIPAWCSGAGRALLLDHTTQQVAELFREVEFIGAGGPAAPRTPMELAERIRLAAELGVATAVDEFEHDVIEVAAPARDRRGVIVAALSAAVASSHAGTDPALLAESVRAAAGALTSWLAVRS